MRLYLKNIGKLSEADIELNGITVIAGENDTGKSTIGKSLFSIFNSFYDIENKINYERTTSITSIIQNSILSIASSSSIYILDHIDYDEVVKNLLQKTDASVDDSILKSYIFEQLSIYDSNITLNKEVDESITKSLSRIKEALTVSDDQLMKRILMKNLYSEFGKQICNINSHDESIITLTIKSSPTNITIINDEITDIVGRLSLGTEVIYIDDPFIIDEKSQFIVNPFLYEHRKHLKRKLFYNTSDSVINDIITDEKLKSIISKLNIVCDGIIEKNNTELSYRKMGYEPGIQLRNISTGLKTFIIIKMLLKNGAINYNGTIVLDEPEVHLHPEWQLIFAEIIVLLQKEFDMHILLNTHSPYFLNAIEVYSKKHNISNKCNYYLSENDVDNNISKIVNVSNETNKIYDKLYRPFQALENEESNY